MQSECYAQASRTIKPQYIHTMKYYTDMNLYGTQENARDKTTWKKVRTEKYIYLSMPVCKHTRRGRFLPSPFQFKLFVFLVFSGVLFKKFFSNSIYLLTYGSDSLLYMASTFVIRKTYQYYILKKKKKNRSGETSRFRSWHRIFRGEKKEKLFKFNLDVQSW